MARAKLSAALLEVLVDVEANLRASGREDLALELAELVRRACFDEGGER